MANRILVSFLFLYSLSLAAQQSPVKEDFAFGNEITVTDPKSVVQITLPEDIYLTSKSPTLSDIAIFNSKNEVVPHLLVNPEIKTVEKTMPPVDLTLFPVYGAKGDEASLEKVRVSTSKNGAIVEIQNGKKEKPGKTTIGYLIDASKIETGISKIQFSLDSAQENYFIKVAVEGSDDLKIWSAIESDGVLGKFEINSERLIRDEVKLDGAKFKYYRLAWRTPADEVKLSAAKAIFSTEKEKSQETLQWKSVNGAKIEDQQKATIYQYDVGGYYPVSAMKVQFVDPNSVAQVSIESAMDEKGPWSPVQSASFYSVTKDSASLSNLETSFGERQSRFWRVRLNSNMSGVGNRFPDISFGWRAKVIRFLARGEGPFTLAYGSSKVVNAPQTDLINSDWAKEVGAGTLKDKMTFGGTEKLVVIEKTNYPWKKIILWGLLLLGVVFLGSMALQVKKQTPPNT